MLSLSGLTQVVLHPTHVHNKICKSLIIIIVVVIVVIVVVVIIKRVLLLE